MDRRTFMGSVAIAAALFSVLSLAMIACAWAQQPAKLPKVAILSPRAPTAEACGANMQGSSLPCFLDAMRELGYVDGKNVSFEFRFAEDDYKKLPALAAELVRLRPDVILTAGPGADCSRERDDHDPDHRRSGRRGNADAACRQFGAPDRKCDRLHAEQCRTGNQVPAVPEGVGATRIAGGAAAQSGQPWLSRLSGHPGTGGWPNSA